jgi:hypothetical protein
VHRVLDTAPGFMARLNVVAAVTILFCTSFGVGDWDGDGYQDILARQDSTSTVRQPVTKPC